MRYNNGLRTSLWVYSLTATFLLIGSFVHFFLTVKELKQENDLYIVQLQECHRKISDLKAEAHYPVLDEWDSGYIVDAMDIDGSEEN